MGNVPALDIEGYSMCSNCPELHPKILLWRLGGVCPDCIDRAVKPLRVLELQLGNVHVPYRIRRPKGGSKGSKSTKKLAERAKMSALRRMRTLFPDIYAAFLAEERAIRGLEPWYVTETSEPLDFEELQDTVRALVATYRPPVA